MASSQKKFDTDLDEDKIEIPADLVNIILEYEEDDIRKISSCKMVPLVSTLFNTIKTQKLANLRTLLAAIVSGKPDAAKAILEKDPSLLYEKLEEGQFVTAPSGNKFNLKPYQAALSVDDTQMAEMIKSYFAKLQDEKEADRQFDEQYPTGWEAAEEKKWQPIFDQLDKLANAIRDSKEDDITSSGDPAYIVTVKKESTVEKELHEFWRLLDATLNEVITAGKRPFNPNFLLKAMRIYDDEKHYKECFGGHWNDPRALLFAQQVIGYDGIQGIMPVNYVEAYQDGLYNTVSKLIKHVPQGRAIRFEIYRSGNLGTLDFYPLQRRGSPGFNFLIYGMWSGQALQLVVGGGSGANGLLLSQLMSIKNTYLQNLRPRRETVDLSRQNRIA